MAVVRLGNPRAVVAGSRVPLGVQVTTVTIPGGHTAAEQMRTITHQDGVWPAHSDAPGPVWVESDDHELAAALAAHYGCPIGEPEDWEVQA
jgi:hypothetical protein